LLRTEVPVHTIGALRGSQRLADTWLGSFYLGRAYVAAKAYSEAGSDFDNCPCRSGEATAVFLDEEPSYHLVPCAFVELVSTMVEF
jgi:hypothetical protein